MRAYELMVIFDTDVDDAAIQGHLKSLITDTVESNGGSAVSYTHLTLPTICSV